MSERDRIVRVDEVKVGDIVKHEFSTGSGQDEYFEVTHIEPDGAGSIMLVYRGAKVCKLSDDNTIRLADPADYEQHRAAIAEQQKRHQMVGALRELLSLIEDGLPLPDRWVIDGILMPSADAVRDAARRLGAEAVERPNGEQWTTEVKTELGTRTDDHPLPLIEFRLWHLGPKPAWHLDLRVPDNAVGADQ